MMAVVAGNPSEPNVAQYGSIADDEAARRLVLAHIQQDRLTN